MFTLEPSEISPTLAEFFNVPFHTKMNEEDIVLSLWKYIKKNNLLIDNRLIVLDTLLKPVMHPFFIWKGNDCNTEQSIVMVYIAKMHLDSDFIQQDTDYRLENIRKNIALRRIIRFFRTYCTNLHDTLWKPPQGHMIQKTWVSYLATHYANGNGYNNGHIEN